MNVTPELVLSSEAWNLVVKCLDEMSLALEIFVQ